MTTRRIVRSFDPTQDNLLGILHRVQNENPRNYLDEKEIREVSEYLELPYSFVYGVATFYSMFSVKPRGRHVIRVCASPPCHLMGGRTIRDEIRDYLGVEFGGTTEDGLFTLELSSCLGTCGIAPAMMIDDELYGNLDSVRLREIVDKKRREAK